MKILLVSQNFCPENFKSNDIAFELIKKGYDVSVLTGIPNYPEGKYWLLGGVLASDRLLYPRGQSAPKRR